MKFGTESITFREAKKAKDDIAIAVRGFSDYAPALERMCASHRQHGSRALATHVARGEEGGEHAPHSVGAEGLCGSGEALRA